MKKHSVLIVEDNANKRVEIERALLRDGFEEPLSVPSIAQAYRAIENKPWSLVILDMTFQVAQNPGHETNKEALAGIELLQFMARRQVNVPVIVATQHSSFSSADMPGIDSIKALDSLLKKLFPRNYRETIEVDLSEESWKLKLQAAASRALGGKRNADSDN